MRNKNIVDINYVLNKFNISSKLEEYGNGHINDTYLTTSPSFILQRINTDVFNNPEELMENIENVTEFIKKKIIAEGGNPERETLTIVKTDAGKNFFKYNEDNTFRVYKFIDNSKSIEHDKTLEDLYNAGKSFGKFQNMLDDFPVDILHETIKDFHNTPKRVEALKKAIQLDNVGRACNVKNEIEFALNNAEFADKVVNGISDGTIPLRVTHNDTKINNILFDQRTGQALAVIDLDTVMPGSALYDFGDALRMGASTAAEDETDLDKVHFDDESFTSFAKGFCEEMMSKMTEMEISLLAFSAKLMTYECGIRFLTDYLNGDTYFKINHENHNLDRARNQFKLVREIKEKENILNNIVKELE